MRVIHTERAPEPVGPYVQGYEANGTVYTSMQLPIDPADPDKAHPDITAETAQLIDNVLAVVRAGGGNVHTVVKTTIYMTNLDELTAVNKIYAEKFGYHKPARSVVHVASIPKGYRIAMEAIALTE